MYIDNPTERPVPGPSSMRVKPDTILAVRDAIKTAVDKAKHDLRVETARFRVSPCGADPVSLDAAAAWNYRLVDSADSHSNRIQEYLDGLYELIEKLSAAALSYGRVERANAEAFRAADA